MIKLKRILGNIKNILGNCLTFVKDKSKQFFPWLKAILQKTKKWFISKKKHEKFVIGGISLATLLVIIVCGFTIDFSGLLGSVYDIDDIGSNIDDIKIGDKINYTGNGYSNWEVLNINKVDNTIDIVAKTTTEYVSIPCEINSCNDYYTILQDTAEKYLDGKSAIRARSIGQEDFNSFKRIHSSYDDFWINAKDDSYLYYSHGSQWMGDSKFVGYYVPIVELYVSDSSNFSIGDVYNYTLNGINEWFVMEIIDNTTIAMVPKYAPTVKDNLSSLKGYFEREYSKYYGSNVLNVYSGIYEYIDTLNKLNYGKLNSKYSRFYTGNLSDVVVDNYVNGSGVSKQYTKYSVYAHISDDNYLISDSSSSASVYVYTFSSGFRPVITIKYNDEKEPVKENEIDHNLKVGDYVKYSANGYNNWKVLNVDEKNNTVDIISGGIVKNITLEGKDSYDNLSKLLQEEVDKYKTSKDAINARAVTVDDFDNLKSMNDQLSAQYFLNNKIVYQPLDYTGKRLDYFSYLIGIGYYDSSTADITKDWALIGQEKMASGRDAAVYSSYKYTAGLRPVITLKLPKVEKIENIENVPSVEASTTILIEEQIRVNKSAQPVIKDSEIKEENIVKEVGCDLAKCDEIKIKQDSYIDFIVLILINIVLTFAVFTIDKVGEWLKKHKSSKKIVTSSAGVLVLVVATVFGLSLNSSNIAGNVYGINSIGYNIDNIKVGDTINYKANGYKDWQVLNINKEDNTIDIVSKTSTENVSFKFADLERYSEILQETANKYLNGKEVISVRAVNEDDLKNFDADDNFWIDKTAQGYYHTNIAGYWPSYFSVSGSILPVVTITAMDTTNFKAGDSYVYSLNGIDEWVILYVDDSTSISIIPKEPVKFELAASEYNVGSYVNNEISKYKNDDILNVRSILSSDRNALNSIGYGNNRTESIYLYTGKLLSSSTGSDNYNGVNNSYTNFKYEYLYCYWGNGSFSEDYSYSSDNSYESGFRPVVTIKYSDKEKDGKDINKGLQVGDYVKYSANGYNNWKVLSIDKEKNTVDIISGGLVKNITLEGKESYDNIDTIFQEEVDKYKTGKYAISARMVSSKDFDDLRIMKDKLSVRFFINDKMLYTDKGTGNNFWGTPTYTVGVVYYDSSVSDISNEWSVLAQANGDTYDSYKYTSGLRPIITLDLNKVEEVKENKVEDVTSKNETFVKEQKKYNKYSQAPIKNDKTEANGDTIKDEVTDNEEPLVIVNDLECKCEEKDPTDSVKYNLLMILLTINLAIVVVVVLMNLFGFKFKRKKS